MVRPAELVLSGVIGLLMGCRPTATLPATPSSLASTTPNATVKHTPPAADMSAALAGPHDPEDPRVVFEWIDTHVAELRRRRANRDLELTKRKLDDQGLEIEVVSEGETMHAVAAEASCSDHEEPLEGMWMNFYGGTTRSYYLFEGQLVAVLEEKSTWWSSNEIGECNDFASTEAYFIWQGRLLAHWIEERRVNCYCSDDEDEEEDDPCDLRESTSSRPEAALVSFSDDPVVQQLSDELRELISSDPRGPDLDCEVSRG